MGHNDMSVQLLLLTQPYLRVEIILWVVVEGECDDGAEHAEHQEGPAKDLRESD